MIQYYNFKEGSAVGFDRDESCIVVDDEIAHETDKAILCRFGSDNKWLPKSQIDYDPNETENVSIEIPYWLLEEKELEDFVE